MHEVPEALRRSGGTFGEVLHIDRFGNVITNIPGEWARAGDIVRLRVGRATPRLLPVVRSYHELTPGGSAF